MSADSESSFSTTPRAPSFFEALIPLLVLVFLLALSVYYFADDSSYGANQIALLCAAFVAAIIGMRLGYSWKSLEQSMIQGIGRAMIAILVLLAVGCLIGTWLLSGTVPALIYYGLQIISPEWFYSACCLCCAFVAMMIGSSWTVAGTIGVAFMGIAAVLELNPAIAAGAVISGAYFGDKLSPLSETTNLAAAVTETDLFAHIRYLLWTTIPGFVIALLIFQGIAGTESSVDNVSIKATQSALRAQVELSLWLLLPPLALIVMAWRGVAAFPAIMIAALLGGVFAAIFQSAAVNRFVANPEFSFFENQFVGVWTALFNGYSLESGNADLDKLLSRGGMSSMLNTVWLIICAMAFGGVMEKTGLLHRLLQAIIDKANNVSSLIVTTAFTCIGTNIITADQYISIILPGRMFRLEYERMGLASENLSRTLEDSGTLTSPLVPWNTCGVFMSGALGVSVWSYAPYAFFNWLGPVLCIGYAISRFKLRPLESAIEAKNARA